MGLPAIASGLKFSQLANTSLTDLNSDKSNAEGYTESNVLPVRE
jgi:hypothetical protein